LVDSINGRRPGQAKTVHDNEMQEVRDEQSACALLSQKLK